MKTPLSFLARLMARGRAEEKQTSPISPVALIEQPKTDDAAETSYSSTATEPAIEPEAAPVEVAPVAESDRTAEDTVAGGVVAAKTVDEDLPSPVPEPAEVEVKDQQGANSEVSDSTQLLQSSPMERRAKRAARVSKVSAEANANMPIVAEADPEVDQVFPAVSDEEALDAEIASLRQQLAQKLRLQNAQLKERLARFDRV